MLKLLVLLTVSGVVYSTDIKQRIATPPPPMPGFNEMAYYGRWFILFRKAPCSWPGSSYFSDYEDTYIPEGEKSFLGVSTWRSNGVCNSVTIRFIRRSPGIYTLLDNMGDSFSGMFVLVATDYKNFGIFWRCTKMAATGNICKYPGLGVATRMPNPPAGVVAIIDNALQSILGVSVGELTRHPQQMPCGQSFVPGCKKF